MSEGDVSLQRAKASRKRSFRRMVKVIVEVRASHRTDRADCAQKPNYNALVDVLRRHGCALAALRMPARSAIGSTLDASVGPNGSINTTMLNIL